MNRDSLPRIIQGGMGAGVSNWSLARAVSKAGQLGVVSGTAMDLILARRLQLGDPGAHMRRALKKFPIPEVAQRILQRYFVPGGKAEDKPFKATPVPSEKPSRHSLELTVAGNFVEVFLAKEGHSGPIGINYLEKIQLPTLPAVYGAMLAGVTYVLMGAGIPRAIPGILDSLAQGDAVELRLDVQDAEPGDIFTTNLDPAAFFGGVAPKLDRPQFFAIVSSATLANMLARKATGRVDGFIVEGPTAGGHNAPPRAAEPRSARKASRCMAGAIPLISPPSGTWDLPSGWPAPTPNPSAWPTRSARERPACRSAPPSPTARNPDWIQSSRPEPWP